MGDKTKIDWCDASWNPVTGCLHGCEYCYARNNVTRYGEKTVDDGPHYIGELHRDMEGNAIIYPFGFAPTFHAHRLDIPQRWKRPRNIFVVSMGDLFGDWVPDGWIKQVFEACEAAPQHRYLFLTKNPKRYDNVFDFLTPSEDFYLAGKPDPIMLFGTSASNYEQMVAAYESSAEWVSIEPIHESIEIEWFTYGEDEHARWKWVVVGAETGNRKGKIIPKSEWIDDIVAACRESKTPIFMKNSLRDLMGDDFRQEYPWEVEK